MSLGVSKTGQKNDAGVAIDLQLDSMLGREREVDDQENSERFD